ncbi:MAG: hypothetical protein NTV32_07325, partial [Gammaproteobacteria bacterium]|nr:hypothetical protein [Gammaproteobacteria bacterium]
RGQWCEYDSINTGENKSGNASPYQIRHIAFPDALQHGTANVILNTAFGEPTLAVDTHIFRVAQRLGLAKGKTPLAIEQQLLKKIPAEYKQDAHHWLILHGRYICKARNPLCGSCFLSDICPTKINPNL